MVVGSDDPTEKAAGRGLGILRDEGVEVVVAGGELAARARLLNQPFRKHARTGRPYVLFKSAMTLDGKVATRTGDSKWISGEASRRLAHHWRAECDAVAVGIGTALADDPLLTARVEGVHRQPRRIVFDSEARLPLDSQLVRGAAELPLTVVISRAAPRLAADALEVAGRRGDRRHRRERARARAQRAQPDRRGRASPRSCSRAARTWPAPSSTPARSTRSACSWRPWCSAARTPATRSRARASSGSPRPCARSRSSASGWPTTC